MIRLALVISFLVLSYVWGGGWGVYGALLICGLLGAIFPAHARVRESSDVDDKVWEQVEQPARRGRNADPTRPDDTDHPLMLTNVISRRR
jgi:hypothetical protein